jgi:hypothetical protein
MWGSAPIELRDPRVDGSPFPLGLTASNELIGISKSLWGRKHINPGIRRNRQLSTSIKVKAVKQ